jgi:hypothetical protein
MITIFLLGIYNGLFIAWKQNSGSLELKISKLWHLLGRVIILFLFLDIYLKDVYFGLGWVFLFCVFNLSWTVYNLTINLVRRYFGAGIPIFHIGNGGFDGWLKSIMPVQVIWGIGLLLIIANIILL